MIAPRSIAKPRPPSQATPVEMCVLGRPAGLLLGLLMLAACSGSDASDAQTTAVATTCAPIAPTECPEPAPHYPDVAPIFERRCASCHGIAGGPWPLDNYEHVADWASFVRDELLRCSMPPPDSGVTMPAEERDQILAWVRCGSPK